MNQRQVFLQHIAQTSPSPLALEIVKARGVLLQDRAGKTYIDLIAGISVCNVGHCHPKVNTLQPIQPTVLLVYTPYLRLFYTKLKTKSGQVSLRFIKKR